MSYQVFARKYRPQIFDDVLGQDHVVQTLKNAIQQRRLAHAYLFVGPRGTGKTSTARILAKALNCVHGPTPTPCGVCDSCREIALGISLDVLEIDGASNNSVDQVRELRDNVRFAPVRGRYKVYIIDEVHMLTQQAFNALLKTLEEPPQHVIFVFATTEPHKVLPTILSRCQRFDLHRIPPRVIAQHLNFIATQEGVTLSAAASNAIATAADGGLRDAESMLDQLVAFCGTSIDEQQVLEVFGLTAEQVVLDLSQAIITRESTKALHLIHAQQEAGKDLSKLLTDLLNFLRSLLIAQVDAGSLQDEQSEKAKAVTISLKAQLNTGQLLRLMEILSEVEPTLKWATNKKLHLELAVIRAIQSLAEVGFDQVLDALEGLRQGPGNPRPAGKSGSAPLVIHAARTPGAPETPASPTKLTEFQTTDAKSENAKVEPEREPAKPAVVTKEKPIAETVRTPEPPVVEAVPETVSKSSGSSETIKDEPVGTSSRSSELGTQTVETKTDEQELVHAEPDLNQLWIDIVTEVRKSRPLIQQYFTAAVPVSLVHNELRLGFGSQHGMAMETLLRPNNRKYIEQLLTERLGKPTSIKGETRDDLAPIVFPEKTEATTNPETDFKNDPLIQKALEIFQAEIQAAD
ncbi:MAG: DNA polymerase III subunit gamma/tau [Verrucomicrobia bacterium]|nr:DNA polymerase III subunit gamma/tau [Verrucomicrobiota bacterium]MBV8485004.1 DNA polymerase III subunit gamma/tau [Verrucomicrobiota bacterium]